MEDKTINFLLVLITGKVWSYGSDMTKWLDKNSYYKLDIWQNEKCMEIIRTQFLPNIFSVYINNNKNKKI